MLRCFMIEDEIITSHPNVPNGAGPISVHPLRSSEDIPSFQSITNWRFVIDDQISVAILTTYVLGFLYLTVCCYYKGETITANTINGRGEAIQSRTGDPTKVIVSVDEVVNSTPDVVPEQYVANTLGSNMLDNNEEVAGHDTNGSSEGTSYLNKAFSVLINVTDSPTDPNKSGRTSYTKLVTSELSRKRVNFPTSITPVRNGADVAIPLESIRAISEWFANTTYGFFLEKRMAYPVDGLDAMMENGHWFIRNNTFIMKKWNPDVNLQKEDVDNVPIWVKFLGVPMTAFSEDGLSIIATKLDTPLMLDSYTSDMCMQSLGRSSYAREMIELRADEDLKDTIMVAILKLIGEGFNICTICVEYE
ncbi:zinc finger, CCHC-type containing protein [Tanacetum coccineum]